MITKTRREGKVLGSDLAVNIRIPGGGLVNPRPECLKANGIDGTATGASPAGRINWPNK